MTGSLPVANFCSLFAGYHVSSLTGAVKEPAASPHERTGLTSGHQRKYQLLFWGISITATSFASSARENCF
jgi:hypothetical protein